MRPEGLSDIEGSRSFEKPLGAHRREAALAAGGKSNRGVAQTPTLVNIEPSGCISANANRSPRMPAVSTDRITKEIMIKAPRTKVWKALTELGQFQQWFGAALDTPF